MTDAEIDEQPEIIWGYMQLHEQPQKCDAVFCLCVRNTRVAEYAARLFLEGFGDWLILSGGFGKLTKDSFTKPELKYMLILLAAWVCLTIK